MNYFIIAILVLIGSPCYAYLDGGSSSMLLQLLLGGVAGGMVFLKIYWRKLLSFFKLKAKDENS